MGLDQVSVLIPYKRGANKEWLEDALGSIPAGVTVIRLENDGELADALNAGLEAATTEYVIRLDADDLFHENTIGAQLALIEDADVTYPMLCLVTEDLKRMGEIEADEFCGNRLQIQNYVPGAGSLFRREAALQAGGYRDLEAMEDWDLWVRMHRAGARFKACPDAIYFYRQVSASRNKFDGETYDRLKREIVPDPPELAATWYAQETIATTYWRALLPARFLPGQVVKHHPQVEVHGDDDFRLPHHRGAAIWQFPGLEYERYAMAAMQELGFPVLMECDDNYLVRRTYGRAWQKRMPTLEQPQASTELHRRVLGWVDGVIVASEHLGNQYRKHTDAPVFVCPNQIDPSDWLNPLIPDDDGKFRVGWSASASHLDDTKLVAQALEWCAKQRDVEVVVMGVFPREFVGRFPFVHVPWTSDISAHRRLQGILDLGVAPVVEGTWASCRSDLKVLEMAMSGAACLASDAIPYRDWTDGQYVRKARTPRDFLRVIREMVNDKDGTRAMAAECKKHVLAERTMAGNVWRWQEAIEQSSRELVAA